MLIGGREVAHDYQSRLPLPALAADIDGNWKAGGKGPFKVDGNQLAGETGDNLSFTITAQIQDKL